VLQDRRDPSTSTDLSERLLVRCVAHRLEWFLGFRWIPPDDNGLIAGCCPVGDDAESNVVADRPSWVAIAIPSKMNAKSRFLGKNWSIERNVDTSGMWKPVGIGMTIHLLLAATFIGRLQDLIHLFPLLFVGSYQVYAQLPFSLHCILRRITFNLSLLRDV
jgi:hypothetical protein